MVHTRRSRRRRRRRRLVLGLVLVVVAFLIRPRCAPELTVATFNIEMFPHRDTDRMRVAEVMAEIDADVLSVQEIRDRDAFEAVVADASRRTGRSYRTLLSHCLEDTDVMSPGFVYDASRLRLLEVREYPELNPDGRGQCSLRDLPGVLAVLEDEDGERVAALAVHLSAFPTNWERRKEQLARTLQILRDVEAELDAHVIALGDFNTTGFTSTPVDERRVVEAMIDAAGLTLTTADVPCTEYYRPHGATRYEPSILDHIVLRDGDWDDPEILGLCQRLQCAPTDGPMPPDYTTVSDHCPVRLSGHW